MTRLAIFIDGGYIAKIAQDHLRIRVDFEKLSHAIRDAIAATTAGNLDLLRTLLLRGLSVCWVEVCLRFWDRAQQRYLPDQKKLANELSESQARIRELEEKLRRRDNP